MDKEEIKQEILTKLPDWNRNRVKAVRELLGLLVDEFVTEESLLSTLEELELDQDNRVKILDIGVTSSVTYNNILADVVSKTNNLIDNDTDYKLVLAQQIPIISIIKVSDNNLAEEILFGLIGKGKGEYGQNGNTTISTSNLKEISRRIIQASDPLPTGPNTYFENLGEIADGNYLNKINTSITLFEIDNVNINWFFEFTQGGDRVVLSFTGDLGTYGLGEDPMLITDLKVVLDNRGTSSVTYNLKIPYGEYLLAKAEGNLLDSIQLADIITGFLDDNYGSFRYDNLTLDNDITNPDNYTTISSSGYQALSEKGQPDGYAPLDSNGKVPAANLPSYVDDVLEYANIAAFPVTGENGKIYLALDTNFAYRWSGSAYVKISDVDAATILSLYKTGLEASSNKTILVDEDLFSILNSEDSNAVNKARFSSIRTSLQSTFNSVYSTIANANKEYFSMACSNEDSDLEVGEGIITFRMPYAMTLSTVRANVKTAPTGAILIVNIKQNGTTILSTMLSIDDSEKTSVTAGTPVVISNTALLDDAEITVDITQVGSTLPGTGLKVTLIGTRTS